MSSLFKNPLPLSKRVNDAKTQRIPQQLRPLCRSNKRVKMMCKIYLPPLGSHTTSIYPLHARIIIAVALTHTKKPCTPEGMLSWSSAPPLYPLNSAHHRMPLIWYAKWWRCAMISLSGGIIAASISHVVRSSASSPPGLFPLHTWATAAAAAAEKIPSEFWCMCAPLTTRVLQPSWLGSRGALSPFFSHKPKSLVAVVFFSPLSYNLHDERPMH